MLLFEDFTEKRGGQIAVSEFLPIFVQQKATE